MLVQKTCAAMQITWFNHDFSKKTPMTFQGIMTIHAYINLFYVSVTNEKKT